MTCTAKLDDYLETACGDDRELRTQVVELLEAGREDSDDMLADARIASARRALESLADGATEPWQPDAIGSYTIVRQIGHGGMAA